MKKRELPLSISRELRENLIAYRGKTKYSEGKSEFSYRKLSEKINVSRSKMSKLVNWDGYSKVDFLSLEDIVALQIFFRNHKIQEVIEKTAEKLPFSQSIEVVEDGKVLVSGDLARTLQELVSPNRYQWV